jgi:diguanylate cyclase (GGDEF)-like protein
MNATLELDVLSVVLLIFAIALASRSLQSKPSNRWSILAAVTLLIVIGTELFAYRVDDIGVSSQGAPHRITNVLGFGLSPIVCYFLFRYIFHTKYQQISKWLFLPFSINGLLSILSYFNGWYFSVDPLNVYRRGPFFALATPIVGAAIQIISPPILTLWPGIVLSLLLFYLFLQEQYHAFDVLTGLRNRLTFMRDFSDLQRICKGPTTIVVCDVNELKKDTYGHTSGDDLLVHAGGLLERCFRGVGKAYRIGGDEFAVISTKGEPLEIERSLSLLESQIKLYNKNKSVPLSLATGWSWCESCGGNLFNTYVATDNNMYDTKKKMKQGRR